jgi:hypothetical protein
MFWIVLGIAGSLTLISCGFPVARSVFTGILVTLLGPLMMLLHPAAPLVLWGVLAMICGKVWARKGYSPLLGILLGIVGGPFGLLAALAVPYTASGREMEQLNREIQIERDTTKRSQPCPECGRINSATALFCPRCNYRFAAT